VQNKEPYLVKDFVEAVRHRIGDTSRSVPIGQWIAFINTAFRRILRQEGLERLAERRDTWELAYLNKDGTPSASWDLGKVGKIIDIDSFVVLKAVDGTVCEVTPTFMEYAEFKRRFVMPEAQEPGDPSYYTLEQIGSITRLVFNRPPRELLVLDMKYSATYPRITNQEDEILLAWEYADILEEAVIILHKAETTDNATARAMWEDFDVFAADLVQQLARRKKSTGYRRIARSW
jgi:hypothetical protein